MMHVLSRFFFISETFSCAYCKTSSVAIRTAGKIIKILFISIYYFFFIKNSILFDR